MDFLYRLHVRTFRVFSHMGRGKFREESLVQFRARSLPRSACDFRVRCRQTREETTCTSRDLRSVCVPYGRHGNYQRIFLQSALAPDLREFATRPRRLSQKRCRQVFDKLEFSQRSRDFDGRYGVQRHIRIQLSRKRQSNYKYPQHRLDSERRHYDGQLLFRLPRVLSVKIFHSHRQILFARISRQRRVPKRYYVKSVVSHALS